MQTNVLHTTVLLQALIAMLHDEGIEINTSAALNIEKVLFNTDLTVYDTFSKLKYRIVPIISRNKEEQNILYKIFDLLDDKIKKEERVLVQPIDSKFSPSDEIDGQTGWKEKFGRLIKSKKFKIASVIAVAIIAVIIISLPFHLRQHQHLLPT